MRWCLTVNDAGEQCIYGSRHTIAHHRFPSEVEATIVDEINPTDTRPEVWARTDERVAALKQLVNLGRHMEFREVDTRALPTREQVEAVMEMLRESELERAAMLRRART
jgi:hypothetical protein